MASQLTNDNKSDLSTVKFNIELALNRVRDLIDREQSDHDVAQSLSALIITLHTGAEYANYARRDVLERIMEPIIYGDE